MPRRCGRRKRQNKMLLIYFCDLGSDCPCKQFKAQSLDDPQVRRKLQEYVCVELPLDAKINSGGKEVVLLEHEAFREMLGKPGIAIVDFRSPKAPLRGAVVSTFPITETCSYTPERMAVILDLPPGTLTQRTLIYAVRTHPEKPESTDGELLPAVGRRGPEPLAISGRHPAPRPSLLGVAFSRIVGRLPGGLAPAKSAPRAGRARTWWTPPSSASDDGGFLPAIGTPCGPSIASSATT